MPDKKNIDRRRFLGILAAAVPIGATATFAPVSERNLLTKKIPSSGVDLPVVGMGTWITFNVGNDERARAGRSDVLRAFFEGGGGMIDSSPM